MIIGTNFKLSSKKYLDNRQQCASLNDLIINKDSILYPQGFEVYCIKEKAWYQNVSEGDTPEWKIRQSGTSEGGASIDDTKISATTTWSSEYIYDMKLELQDLITQTEDYVAEIDDRLLYVEGRLTSIGSFDGSYDSLTNKPEFPSLQGYATHEYVDEVIANIGKIEGTKDYNELINQPINNATIEYMIDERLIVNVDYLEAGKWYIINTDLNEEYNSATAFSLVYYLSSDSYSIINTFENEDMHSFIYVSSINEKEIKIKYTTIDGKTYELIYNKETNEKTLNLLTSSGGNGNGGFSGNYNDLTNKPFYDTRIIDNVNLVIDKNMDLSNYETKDILISTDSSFYYKLVKLRPAYPGDIDNMKKSGMLIIEDYTMPLNQVMISDESYGEDVAVILEFVFVIERDEFLYFPGGSIENGVWLVYSSYTLDENGEHINQENIAEIYNGMIIQYDSLSGELKQLDEKFIPDDFKDYNKLINKPCYDLRVPEIETSIVFDGNATGKETVLVNSQEGIPLFTLVKMTDKPITFEEFYSTNLINFTNSNGEEVSNDLENGYLSAYKDMLILKHSDDLFYMDELGVYVACKTSNLSVIDKYWGDCIITPGIWFTMESEEFVSKFVYKRFAEDNIEIEICPCYEESLETITLEDGIVYKKIYPCITEEQINFIKADKVNNLHYGILNGTKNENNEIILDEETFESLDNALLTVNDGYYNIGEYLMLVYEDIEVDIYTFTKGIWVLSFEGLCHRLSLKIASNFKQLDEKFIPDTIATKKYVDNAIINTNSIVRPYEVFRVEETIFGKTGYIDVETMKPSVKYGLTEEYLDCNSFAFIIPTVTTPYAIVCIASSFQVSDLIVTEKWEGDPSKGEVGLYIIVKGLNIDYKINIKHKESKDGITIESIRNTKYLDINNTKEFIPTGDYQPTTKKYVDDLVSNVDIDLSDYITNTELEGKGYITEIPSEYITDTELEEKGYVTDTELEEEMIFETDSLTVNSLGGISANTNLNGLTVKEILNKLLYPYIEPVITVTATPNGGTYEKGSTQTITNVKVVVTKKSEKITKIEVLNGTQVLARQQDEAINNGGTFNYNVNVSVPSTNKQLTVKVTDNSGNAITKTTNAFTFVYPYYYGVCDEGTTINGDLIKSLTKSVEIKGTKTVTYTTNNQRMIFAYPKSYGVITKILDPNSFDVTSTFTMSQITIIGLDGTGQSYYVYVNSPSTVSNFNMKFSY